MRCCGLLTLLPSGYGMPPHTAGWALVPFDSLPLLVTERMKIPRSPGICHRSHPHSAQSPSSVRDDTGPSGLLTVQVSKRHFTPSSLAPAAPC
ncbi:hypothetical protein SKAU_G00325490 [Synaphobranchus kaupii]|uniref:Uncharacterized protein n=1 Tax=Synaphobranchus kaupii TaxID=118154 RepID=A0A9Q1EPR6_SYNKA|nr:hypothetical protein SKAU_G00325490 [Synaphobranchus kaupii]